jgi:hypothetical protein
MKSVKVNLIESPFDGLDWSLLDTPDFHESAVREVIITPLLRLLGYTEGGPTAIVRDTRLQHPYVSIGTTRQPISLVPDYLLRSAGLPAWILDAKAPTESVIDPKHEEQAYSYAVHRDVRCDWWAICNGKEFAAFHVADMKAVPRLHFKLRDLREAWGDLWQLAPEMVVRHKEPRGYLKDFGIHLLKLGIPANQRLDFLGVRINTISRVGDRLYSIPGIFIEEGREYFVSLDFDDERYEQLLPLLPSGITNALRQSLKTDCSSLKIRGIPPTVGLSVAAGGLTDILENEKEHYLPLRVEEFRPFQPLPDGE